MKYFFIFTSLLFSVSIFADTVKPISAVDLLDSLKNNKMKFEHLYKNQEIQVYGEISSINDIRKENYRIHILATTAEPNERALNSDIICLVPEGSSSASKIFDLNKGQKITVKGLFNSYGMFGLIQLKNCSIENV